MAGPAHRAPLDELRSTMQRLNRFMDRSDASDFHPLWESDEGFLPVDIEQRAGELLVTASLPGYSKDEVEVHLHQGVLSIRASHADADDHSQRFYRRERYHGPISRRLALPGVIDDPDVTAVFRDGVLTLHVHVAEEHRPRQVAIAGE